MTGVSWLIPANPFVFSEARVLFVSEISAARIMSCSRNAPQRVWNLFTTVSHAAPLSYRFHPLFRDFLAHRAIRSLPPTEVEAISLRSAAALAQRGLIDEAAQVLIDAGAWDALGQLALHQAPALMAQGRQATLAHWLSALPAAPVKADPWLLYWSGVSRAWQDPASARGQLEAAFAQFAARRNRPGLLLAWSGVVNCIFRMYDHLDPWFERLDGLLTEEASFPSPEIEARVTFSMFVGLSFRQPQSPALPMWRARLGAIADHVPDPTFRLLSRMHLLADQIWQGRMHDAAVELETLRRAVGPEPATPFAGLVRHFADSTFALFAGDVQGCFEAIDSALALADDAGIHIWDKIILGQGAALALSYGELDRAHGFIARRSRIATRADDEEQSLHHALLAWSSWLAAMPAQALAHVRHGKEFMEGMGLPYFNALGRLAMSVVSFDCGEQDAGLAQVHAARTFGTLMGNPMLGWMADLLEAYMRLRRGEDATALVESFATVGSAQGYQHGFFWPRAAVALVCLKALELGCQPDYARWLIVQGRIAAPPEALLSDRWPWPVKVTTLGHFSVAVNGTPIEFKGKAQTVPMNLLKVLIAFGGHEVAETRVIDALWPASEGDAGAQALATALSRLRKLIGADTVKRQDGRLSLVASEGWTDCRALQRLLEAASPDGRELLLQVKRLYAGPFLDGDDAPWVYPPRERLHVSLVKRLLTAATRAMAQAEFETALDLNEAGIWVDERVEDFYQGLIQCYAAKDQPSQVAATYRRCQQVLQRALRVDPSPATTWLYLSGMGSKDGGVIQRQETPHASQ